jgi:hypothetical protein
VHVGDEHHDRGEVLADNGPVISERMARWCAERTTQEAVDTLGGAMMNCLVNIRVLERTHLSRVRDPISLHGLTQGSAAMSSVASKMTKIHDQRQL